MACVFVATTVVAATNSLPSFKAADASAPVHIIPIHGQIDRPMHKMIMRGIRQAEKNGAQAIIFDIDTPGGRLDSAEEIVGLLLETDCPTYAFVNPRAISAGAIISFATDGIYMTRTGLIGDAMPILGSPFGGGQAVPEDLRPKIMSPTLALVRSICQHQGRDEKMAEAMVDPLKTYSVNGRLVCNTNELLTLTADEAAEIIEESGKPVLSEGTVADLDDLLGVLGAENAPLIRFEVKPGEALARIFTNFGFSGILLAIGVLGIFIEFKTPGFGIPGLIGISALLLWFFGHQFANISGTFELLLLLAGVILLLLEVFVIPGFGVAGISGICLIGLSIVITLIHPMDGASWSDIPAAQIQHAILTLGVASAVTTVGAVLAIIILPATPAARWLALAATNKGSVQEPSAGEEQGFSLVGSTGETISALRPCGRATIDGKRLDVVSKGQFIDAGKPIEVVACQGNHIEVRPLPEESQA